MEKVMPIDYEILGKRIAARRKSLGLKQYEVCERADLNSKYLSCIETAHSTPSLDVLMRILEVLDMHPDEALLPDDPQPHTGEPYASENYHISTEGMIIKQYNSLTPEGRKAVSAFINWLSIREQH